MTMHGVNGLSCLNTYLLFGNYFRFTMASRQSGSSILKPPKVRAPLKEIESVDQDADEDTATMPKRKVSFSGMNKIKMYNTGATSLTVHQAPMFDEQISMLSDSSNGEKTKSSGKFEKSEGHITFESTNCTNMEENGRVIIEYESPSDNMEMTEAFPGKILSDTVYANDTNGSVKNDYSLDYSANNMEFTGVMGHILTADISYSSSTEMSDTLTNENEEPPETQFEHRTATLLQDTLVKNTSHANSSNMDITFANQKPYSMDLSCTKHQSSCMELTSMSLIPQKSMCLDDDYNYKSCNITELTQPNKQLFENDCEFIYEYDQCSVNMESETTCEIKEQSNYEAKIIENIIAPSKLLEIDNCSNHQIISCELEYFDNNEETLGKCSSNEVAMDIDSVSEDNEYDISYVNIDSSKLVVNDQNNLTVPKTLEVENKKCPVNDVLDIYSNLIEITNENSSFEMSMTPTSSSFVQNMFSVENDMIKSFEVDKQSQKNTFVTHTSMLGQSFEKDIEAENHAKKYSRKSMRYTAPLIQENSSEINTILSDTSVIEANQQEGYSKSPNNPTSIFNQTSPKEFEDYSDTSSIVEEKQEMKYSRKSIVPTSIFEEILSRKNEEFSDTFTEDQHEKLAKKSIVPSISVFDQSQSNEVNTSDSHALAEVQQERDCRKSIKPTSVFDETLLKKNEYLSDTSSVVEEYQQKQYSGQLITSPISAFSPTQFKSDSSVSSTITKDQYKRYSKKSIVPTSVFNQILSKKNEDLSNTTAIDENHQKQCSRKSLGSVSLILTSNEFSEDSSLSSNSVMVKENDKKNLMISASDYVDNFSNKLSLVSNNSEVHQSDLSDNDIKLVSKSEIQLELTNVIANDDFNSPFRKKSRKSIVPTQFIKQSVYDACNENIKIELTDKENQLETNEDSVSEDTEYVSKMDISAEIEPAYYNATNIITEKTNITSSSLLNNISIFKKKSTTFDKSSTIDINPNIDTSQETKRLDENNVCVDDMYEIDEKNIVVSYELEKNKTNLNESTENNTLLKECNDKKINNTSVMHSIDKTTNETCIEDLSNMSISDNVSEKSVLENRKRSYANRDCVPLLSSSFAFKSNAHDYINDSIKKDYLKESPIKIDVSCEISMNTVPQIENVIKIDTTKIEPAQEDLNDEVVEFLTRWNNLFVENKLALDKCTNGEWIFNVLDNNIKLMIKYSPISNDHSYLKVEDILFITRMITDNEITTFGINWILSKYSPKVYKQICFTSRDVELLLKSLLEDIQFISMVMNNMVFVRDVYCVTFKDNKAQFVLQSMHPLFMSCVEISLANIHRLSVKDITIDCLFGCFDTKVLDNIIKNVTIDCYVLQSLIENLRNSICIN